MNRDNIIKTKFFPSKESLLNDMSYFDIYKINGSPYMTLMRVPNGWIYESYNPDSGGITSCFIPAKGEENK